jgi:hypothetical protein
MAFTTGMAMIMVYATYTKGWPEGEAYLIVRHIMKICRSLDTVSKSKSTAVPNDRETNNSNMPSQYVRVKNAAKG